MSEPTYDFEDQVALVTGASSGMGLATARAFAHARASVVLADIDEAKKGGRARTGPSLMPFVRPRDAYPSDPVSFSRVVT
jgi:NAD(P)-dependent dehydrogenase (short-subunit alcohol dehydrogenase family)